MLFCFYVSFPQLDLLGADVWYSRRCLSPPSQGHHTHQVTVAQFLRPATSVFYPSRISDLGSRIQKQQRKRRAKKIVLIPFFGGANFTKLKIITFEMPKKKIWATFQRAIELFTQIIVTKLSKIRVWDPGSRIRDPGSRIRDPEKTCSGSRIQG